MKLLEKAKTKAIIASAALMAPTVVHADSDTQEIVTTFGEVIKVLYKPLHLVLVAISWVVGLVFTGLTAFNFIKSLSEGDARKAEENRKLALKCLIGVGFAVALIPSIRGLMSLFGIDVAEIVAQVQ